MTSHFNYLDLPAELRVEVYRYTLKCEFPITNDYNELVIHEKDKVAIHLLRTCKQIYQEGREIFYGENCFLLCKELDLTCIPILLPKHNLDLLKEVTFVVPFVYTQIAIGHDNFDKNPNTLAPEDRLVSSGSFRVDLLPNIWVRVALDALAGAKQLRRLHLVIRPGYSKQTSDRQTSYDRHSMVEEWEDHTTFRMVNSDVWHDLEALLRCRPALHVSCTRLYYRDLLIPENDHTEEQQALLCKFQNRLGIWDQREAEVVDGEWKALAEAPRYIDLTDFSQAFDLLFAE